MNDLTQQRPGRWTETRFGAPTAVADAAGMVWTHANPAELYRWISRRNALLGTIGVAFAQNSTTTRHPLPG